MGPIDEACKQLGVSRGSLGGYERGERLPDIDFIARLCALTGGDFNAVSRLRLEAAGEPVPDSLAVADAPAGYRVESGEVSGLRAEIQAAGIPFDWALLLMQLAGSGDLSPGGARAIIGFLKQDNTKEEGK